jgi:PKD repeat protein
VPKVSFTVSQTSGCGPLPVSFTNTSSPKDTGSIYIMNFIWDLGNGNISNQLHPSANYTASVYQDSVYQVRLIGYSEHGLRDSSYLKASGCIPNQPSVLSQASMQDVIH